MTEFDPESLSPEERLTIDDADVYDAFKDLIEVAQHERRVPELESMTIAIDIDGDRAVALPRHIDNYLSLPSQHKYLEAITINFDTAHTLSRGDLRISLEISVDGGSEIIVISRPGTADKSEPFSCELIRDEAAEIVPYKSFDPSEINRLITSLAFLDNRPRDLSRLEHIDLQSEDSQAIFKVGLLPQASFVSERQLYIFSRDDDEPVMVERITNTLDKSTTYTLIETIDSELTRDSHGELVNIIRERESQIAFAEDEPEASQLAIQKVTTATPWEGRPSRQIEPVEPDHDAHVRIVSLLTQLSRSEGTVADKSYEQYLLEDEERQRQADNQDSQEDDKDS